jgi:hypothetical protein
VRLEAQDYYEDRPVRHSAQGDIHADLPFVWATVAPGFDASGARKRPSSDPEVVLSAPIRAPGLVCQYTCGFTAQPPGTEGYSHDFRLVAPIFSLRALKAKGMRNNELRKVRDGAHIQGFMYLPQTGQLALDEPADIEDEWTGHAAAALYRATTVTQKVLDARPRLARLTEAAQRILIVALIAVFSPNSFDAFDDDLAAPDMSDGWDPAQA